MLSSSIAVFARAINHFLKNSSKEDRIHIHFDTILVILRYSTICFDNQDFSKYLSRTMNMMNTYTEYIRFLKKNSKDPVMITNDAFQLILHRFPSTTSANRTCVNCKNDFHSEIAMRVFLDRILENVEEYVNNNNAINNLAEDIYRTISTV